MARPTQRLRRMRSRLGSHDDFERARMKRMTGEEIEAEMIELAVRPGSTPRPRRMTLTRRPHGSRNNFSPTWIRSLPTSGRLYRCPW